MASKEIKRELHLRQVSTNEESSCELDVTPEEVVDTPEDGAVLQTASLQVIQESIERDTELTPEQRDKLQFVPDGPPTEKSPVKVQKVVDLLKVYARDIEEKITSDRVIKAEVEKIIDEAFECEGSDETDSGSNNEGIVFALNVVCTHIQEVFRLLLDETLKPDASAITVLTQWGAGLGFCYYLIKRLVITYIDRLTFKGVVYAIGAVLSQLFRHLMKIEFGHILRGLGGWDSVVTKALVGASAEVVGHSLVDHIPIAREYQFLGMGLVSLGMGITFLLAFGYLKLYRK